jgi:protein involved in polysaccharide export with SLBB domain
LAARSSNRSRHTAVDCTFSSHFDLPQTRFCIAKHMFDQRTPLLLAARLRSAAITPATRLGLSRIFRTVLLIACGLLWQLPSAAQRPEATVTQETGGPVRLRQMPTPISEPERPPVPEVVTYVPGEFELFVQRLAGLDMKVRRLGAEIVIGVADAGGEDVSTLVPDDHVVSPGDEVLLTIWGSVDADLRLTVDRAGRIAIPRVGAVQVAGLRQAELRDVITRRVASVFRNFELSVSLGRLRGIRVFVTGQVMRPGAYHVSSLATVVTALMRAGGPSAAGTFRRIEIRRGPALLTEFDLYDLLARGDRGSDRTLQAGDVVHVGPVGPQVAVIGSVNRPAVIELRPGETIQDALRLAGGFGAVADRSRLAIERLEDRSAGRVAQIGWPESRDMLLEAGDVIRVFSAVDAVLPTQRQSKRVRVEGEVLKPGEFVLPAQSSVGDASSHRTAANCPISPSRTVTASTCRRVRRP